MLRSRALSLITLAGLGFGDLPVHCTHRDVLGHWQLLRGGSNGDSSLTCGHQVPDRIMTTVASYAGPANPPFEVRSVVDIELKNPNIALGSTGSVGTWTLVYDEGIEVTLDGWKYFSFFRYLPKNDNADPTKAEEFDWLCHETVPGWYHDELHAEAVSSPLPLKRQPETGWGCFVGVQKSHAITADKLYSSPDKSHRSGALTSTVGTWHGLSEGTFLEMQERGTTRVAGRRSSHLASTPVSESLLVELASEAHVSSHDVLEALHTGNAAAVERLVHRLNGNNALWSARVPEELMGATKTELRARLGASASEKVHIPNHSRGAEAANRRHARGGGGTQDALPIELQVGGHRAVVVDIESLPAELDWTRRDNGVYVPPIVDQGSCGSCYAVASADAITIRARIRSPELARSRFLLSASSVVSCSIFNQGCNGGYPYLVGKSVHELGILEEHCMPYTATQNFCPQRVTCEAVNANAWWRLARSESRRISTNADNRTAVAGALDPAKAFSGLRKAAPSAPAASPSASVADKGNPFALAYERLRVSRYEYVGGYYGAGHETSMLVELQKGPIVVGLNAPATLYMYKSGIFSHSMAPDTAEGEVTPISRWERTNHAVVCVGYGVEGGVKYWKLRNSWGTQFGEDGYFRMVRGVDMLAIESMAVVIDV